METKTKDWAHLLPGDIIIAKRPWENCKHEYSPHIVIENDGSYIYALISSSQKPKYKSRKSFTVSSNINHFLRKDNSYFKLDIYKIPYKNIRDKATWKLTSHELSCLMRRLDSTKYPYSEKKELEDFKPQKIDLQTGDIIKKNTSNNINNDIFVIISVTNNKFICIKANETRDQFYNIHYKFEFSHLYTIDDIKNYKRIDSLYEDEERDLLTYVKNHKKTINNMINSTVKIGSIVLYENCYYYVASVDDTGINMYKIDQSKNYANIVTVQNIKYPVNFTRKIHIGNDTFSGEIISTATSAETFSNIKELVSYNDEKNKDNDNFKKRRCFYKKAVKNTKNLYLLLRKEDDIKLVVNYSKYLNGEIEIDVLPWVSVNKTVQIKPISISDLSNIYEDIREYVREKYQIELEVIIPEKARKKQNIL